MAKHSAIKPKLYIVQKLIHARNAAEAIKLDATSPVESVWIEDEWRKNNISEINVIGFQISNENS